MGRLEKTPQKAYIERTQLQKRHPQKGEQIHFQWQKQLYPQKEEQLHSSRRNISSILA
jgi:hypothetical protein